MAQNGRARCCYGTVPFRNQEPAIRMCFRTLLITVLMAQRQLYLADRLHTFRTRLTLPEHDESLPANTAMHFSVSIGAFA